MAEVNPVSALEERAINNNRNKTSYVKHIHSFVRLRKTKTGKYQWKCSDPDCMFLTVQEMVIGKRTLCPQCLEHTFIITPHDLQRAVPRCPQKCSTRKEHVNARTKQKQINSALEDLFPGRDIKSFIGED